MALDLLSIVVNSQWQTQQVQSGYHATRLFPPDQNGVGRIWEMKATNGWPADVNYYDSSWIYFTYTEADGLLRNDPRSYKRSVGPWGLGFPVLPRFLPSNPLPWIKDYNRTKDSVFEFYQNCAKTGQSSLGTMRFVFDGPFLLDWKTISKGGDIGTVPGYILHYLYDNLETRERFYYLLRPTGGSYGWCGWDLTQNGQVISTSYRNRLVNVAPATPLNPCHL